MQSERKTKEIFFVDEHMKYLLEALQCDKKLIQKRMLKCAFWALTQSEYKIKMNAEDTDKLVKMLDEFVSSDDKSIASTAREIYKII